MTRPLPFTQASIQRAIAAARKAGMRVTGIRMDGTVVLEDGDKVVAAVSDSAQVLQIEPPSSKWQDRAEWWTP